MRATPPSTHAPTVDRATVTVHEREPGDANAVGDRGLVE